MARKGENIYRRKDGRWEGRYKSGFTKDGKPKYISVYGHSYTEVKEKLLPLKAAPPAENNSCKLTVKELFDEWLSSVKLRVKESTLANYQMKIQKHIIPEFGKLKYDDLTAQALYCFIERKINSGLSAKYVSDILIVFKTMVRYAAKLHKIHNKLADIALPRIQHSERNILSDTQQKQLCRYLISNTDLTSLCVLISLYTGLRVGEVCGLMWKDIDFEKNILTVSRTVQRIKTGVHGTKLKIDTPKSKTSRRSLPIPTNIMKILRNFRSKNEYYILSGSGNIVEPRTLQRRFETILKKADIPSVNYHCLRHMFATNCLQAGFDVKTLSEILGHASVTTTLNRYVHSSMERKKHCMELLKLSA